MAQRQLNVRMDQATFDTLEAAAFLEGVSLPEVIRPLIEKLAAELASDHAVQIALRAREESRAARSGKLTRLPSRSVDS
ncbi:MAG TPA: hypothetical protein VK252_07830 [Solirubrobacteraceae bacterium]|nr:hypothetical protein [Solirubrobacteraceae bacterium]